MPAAENAKAKPKVVYTKKSISYGIVNGFSALKTQFGGTYTNFWMTEMGISNVHLGLINTIKGLVTLWGNVVNGVLLQKVRLPHGRYRSWMYMVMPLVLVLNVCFFTNWGLPDGVGKACLYGALLILDQWIYNLVFSAYTGLMIPLAPDPAERVSVSACRSQGNSVFKVLFSLTNVALIAFFGRLFNNEHAGYTVMAFIIMAMLTCAMVFLANYAKNVDPSGKREAGEIKTNRPDNVSFWAMLKSVFSKEMVIWLLISLCKAAPYTTVSGLIAYYYKYVVGDNTLFTTYLSLTTFLLLGGAILAPQLARKWGIRRVCQLGFLLYAAALAAAYLLGKNAVAFTILLACGYIGYSLIHTSELALYTNVVDYTAITRGADTRPFLSSLYMMGASLGSTVGGAVLGFGLATIGFEKSNITAEAADGIRVLLSVLPVAILILGFLIVTFLFKLDEEKLRNVRKEHGMDV